MIDSSNSKNFVLYHNKRLAFQHEFFWLKTQNVNIQNMDYLALKIGKIIIKRLFWPKKMLKIQLFEKTLLLAYKIEIIIWRIIYNIFEWYQYSFSIYKNKVKQHFCYQNLRYYSWIIRYCEKKNFSIRLE